MLETSQQHQVPLAISSLASSPFNSFWNAQGNAMSHFTLQAFLPAVNLACPGNLVAISSTLLRLEARITSI